MQAFLDLAKLWPYLPHFRVVAEYESLSRASRRFGLTSAALSKAIRALEHALDVELFERNRGTLRLNDHGRALLGAVRAAMRDIDDTIAATRGAQIPSSLRVAVDGAWVPLVVPQLPSSLDVELVESPSHIAHSLLRGDVDVVVHAEPVTHGELDVTALATLDRAVCVAAGHPLASRTGLVLADLATVGFAVPKEPSGLLDGWPPHLARKLTFTTSSLAHALAAAASGTVATVAPIVLARSFGLVPLAIAELVIPPRVLWTTIRRPRRGEPSAATRWRDAARTHCTELLSAQPRASTP